MKRALTAVLLLASATTPLAAQRVADGFPQWEYSDRAGPADAHAGGTSPSWNEPSARDYRYEGLFIGGAGLGIFGAIVGHNLSNACPTVPGAECTPDRLGNAVTLGLVGAAVGGGLGYLVGRLSPKPSPRATIQGGAVAMPDSIRKKVGYQHWKGGAIGSAVGGFAGFLLSQLESGECVDCTSPDSNVLELTAIGAGLGGGFGFLVGAASPKYQWVPAGR